MMWQARFYQSLPKIVAEYPGARWLFLTLTVRNCSIDALGETLTAMNAVFESQASQGVSWCAGLGSYHGSNARQGW